MKVDLQENLFLIELNSSINAISSVTSDIQNSVMKTSSMLGSFRTETETRNEFLSLIKWVLY